MSIHLSEKYGLNPAIPICFICGNEKNEIILAGKISKDIEAPKNSVWDYTPCNKCIEYMKQGIILISVKDGETGNNPYRTGGWVVIKEEALKNVIDNDHEMFRTRISFIEDSVWLKLGLPI